MTSDWKKISLKSESSIRNAMQVLDETGLRIILVADSKDRLLGTVTDGDIRRGFLKGVSINSEVTCVMNKNPVCAHSSYSSEKIYSIMERTGMLCIPVLEDDKTIIGFETINRIDEANDETSVVLMAGGFGKRMMPLTKNLPKPMLPLNNKPIIHHIIDQLKICNFKNFFITTHYKSNMIIDYLHQINNLDVNIQFVEEERPLGTAGSLSLLKGKINSDFIVINSDLLIKINFSNFLSFHKNHGEIATLGVRKHIYQVPYGVVSIDDTSATDIIEKPTYTHFISAGVYCFKKDIFSFIDFNKYLDMPDLLKQIICTNENISTFPIHEFWADIGSVQDYQDVTMGEL